MSNTFLQGLPEDTRNLLSTLLASGEAMGDAADVFICHSEPGAWNPPRYSTSLCPPTYSDSYVIGRTMFETDRTPQGWEERMNRMDEIWVPTQYVLYINTHYSSRKSR